MLKARPDPLARADANVRETYARLLATARAIGRCAEERKRTSIHLMRRSAFAGVSGRKTALILTVNTARDIKSLRILKHERVSANRWHLEIRLVTPADVDAEVKRWLREAYALAK